MDGERRRSKDIQFSIAEALVAKGTWRQADLVRFLGITKRTLLAHMERFERLGVVREEDGRDVFYSVEKGWLFGAGVNLSGEDARSVVRKLLFAPASDERDRILHKLAAAVPAVRDRVRVEAVTGTTPRRGLRFLDAVVDAVQERVVLQLDYLDGHGRLSRRAVSPQRLDVSLPKLYLWAWCHVQADLRMFAFERIQGLEVRREEHFHAVEPSELERDRRSRINGYRGDGPVKLYALRLPAREELRWVLDDFPGIVTVNRVADEVRVAIETAAPRQLARYLVGLDAPLTIESEELRDMIVELAERALELHRRT